MNTDQIERPEYNLGLAHGVPGIISAILPALTIPALSNRAQKLLKQSCDWLLMQQLTIKEESFFSSYVNDPLPSRLGWCYGDLTIALTLARVGNALKIPQYLTQAEEMALHSAKRCEKSAGIDDAGVCHGSAGLSLIFQLLNKEIPSIKLEQASIKWLDFTLKLYNEKGMEGLYKPSPQRGNRNESKGFLTGYSGVGLCLISLLNGDTEWTECLSLS
jgi:lantibiotic modifying enzyme